MRKFLTKICLLLIFLSVTNMCVQSGVFAYADSDAVMIPMVSVSDISVEYSKRETDTCKQITLQNTESVDVTADVYGAVYEQKNGIKILKNVDLQKNVHLPANKETAIGFDMPGNSIASVYVWENGSLAPMPGVHETKTVYPEESTEVLKNPYRGLVYYEKNTDLSDKAAEIAGVLYTRYGWNVIEPEEGVYNWSVIDGMIHKAREKGMMLGLGMTSCVNVMNTSDYDQETPDWVFEAGAKYTLENMANGETLKVPVWNDAVFIEKMGNFINAFANRYNSNKSIAFVDIRNFGNWGEWHYSNLPVSKENAGNISSQDLNTLVDLWKNVKLPLMMFKSQTAAKNYAVDTYKTGLRVDGVMNPMYTGEHKYLSRVENISPALGEWFAPGYSAYKSGGAWARYYEYLPVLFENVITESKISYMGLDHWNSKGFYNEFPELCERMANKVGYWFKPVEITYPANLVSGIFKMKIKNDGVAPIYVGHNKKACVKLAIANEENNITEILTLPDIDPFNWKPGVYTGEESVYKFKNTDGACKLYMGVFTDENLENPDISLGISGDRTDGWYLLNTMPSSPLTDISENRIYTATHENARYGYGIHRAEYAFDNDESTFWQAELIEDVELVVDFGKAEKFDAVNLKPKTAISTSCDVSAFTKNGWKTVWSGEYISDDGLAITFDEIEADKLKFLFKSPLDKPDVAVGELLCNGGFEYDVLCDGSWFNYNTSHIKAETNIVNSGLRSLKIYDRIDGYRGVQQDITKQLAANGAGNYRFSVCAMPDGSDVHLRTAIRITYKDGTTQTASKSALCTSNVWNSVVAELVVGDTNNMDNAVLLMENRGEENADLYLDNCSLVKK